MQDKLIELKNVCEKIVTTAMILQGTDDKINEDLYSLILCADKILDEIDGTQRISHEPRH